MEACGSAHHWGRALMALGHDVKLMPSSYVKPYIRRHGYGDNLPNSSPSPFRDAGNTFPFCP